MILEACIETFEEAIKAEKNGAHRIELCSRLDLDGLTPNLELTKKVLNNISIPVKVMIRPRGGDFVYSDQEIQQMTEEIIAFKKLNVLGVVIGILDEENSPNLEQIERLALMANPLEVTFHKAVDLTPDLPIAVENLKKISNITSILTSGGASTAIEGKEILKKMIKAAGHTLTIIPAGKITNSNLSHVHDIIGANEYHGQRIVGKL